MKNEKNQMQTHTNNKKTEIIYLKLDRSLYERYELYKLLCATSSKPDSRQKFNLFNAFSLNDWTNTAAAAIIVGWHHACPFKLKCITTR